MVQEYIQKQLKKARFKKLEDGTYFATIPGLKGIWANAKSLRECKKELEEVLEGWLLLKVQNKERVSGFAFSSFSRNTLSHAA